MITEAIEPLSPKMPDPPGGTWIRKTPGVCGGDACVRNMRIPIWLLEAYRREGLSPAQILEAYPALNHQDLAAAFAYVTARPAEIEAAIQGNEDD